MSDIRAETVLQRHHEASHRIIEGVAMIVSPREAMMVTLNEVGTRVWTLLGELTVAEVAAALVEEFEVELESALADTIGFLEGLQQRGLVVPVQRAGV
jgi:hypothetical protein